MKKNTPRRWVKPLALSALSLSLVTSVCLAASNSFDFQDTSESTAATSQTSSEKISSFEKRLSLFIRDFDARDDFTNGTNAVGPIRSYATNQINLTRKFVCKNKGYQLTFPEDAVIMTDGTGFDARVITGDCTLEITRERSPYLAPASDVAYGIDQIIPDFQWVDGKDQYIGYYESRFLLNKYWQINNCVSVSPVQSLSAGGYQGIYYSAVIADLPSDKPDGYTYLYLKLDDRWFLRIVAKYKSSGSDPASNTAQETQLKKILSTIRTFQPSATSTTVQKCRPERKAAWSEETRELYNRIKNANRGSDASSNSASISASDSGSSSNLLWGIYSDRMPTTGINEKIPALEKKLNYSFSAVMSYLHFYEAFPTSFMKQAYDQGKIVELTFQITDNNNLQLYNRSLFLQLYRQDPDVLEVIRRFARDAKAFGHPFLFRICNEMNSDWVSYGGVVNMADPDIYIENWRTIYKIFEEEGVDNCIWVFNPNDRNAPPDDWNCALNYYPGNEYVDIIGVTGYNKGVFYPEYFEEWAEFEEIYDKIQAEYGPLFDEFPWIITEFSTSSYGGDKPAWIRNMFKVISKYKNIKLAVWFDSADLGSDGTVIRPYWLDETKDSLRAFKNGLTGASYFEDLKNFDWAYDSIYEVTDAGYFKGTAESQFSPDLSVSRAMIFTVIARMAGIDTSTDGEWYLPGMNWAVKNGITDGSEPMSSVTREQLVTMLYRWSESESSDGSTESRSSGKQVDQPASAGSGGTNVVPDDEAVDLTKYKIFLNYPDASLIHVWARDAMKWALEQGIIKGDEFGQLVPEGTATRAETAVMIQRFAAHEGLK